MPMVFASTDLSDITTRMIHGALEEWRLELAIRFVALEEARMTAHDDMAYGGAAATADQSPLQEAVDYAKAQVERLKGEARKRRQGIAPLCVRVVGSQQPTPSAMSPI